MLLGCIADDFTGASDLSNTLTRAGMATVQFVGVPDGGDLPPSDAGVIALKTRTCPAEEAVRRSLDALRWLQAQGCTQILFKICSTFDSTPAGNIGPVAEALADALGASTVAVCPAFPGTGRTVFQGHLFVGDRLLNESGMARHPLTPMTDPDLRRWLHRQTRDEVGLVPLTTVRRGASAVAAALIAEGDRGRRLSIVDAVSDDDLRALGTAAAAHPLLVGGSGLALGLPDNFRRDGRLAQSMPRYTGLSGPGVALSGSCSEASQRQLAQHLRDHPGFSIEPAAVLAGETGVADMMARLGPLLDQLPVVYSTADPVAVAAAQRRFGRETVAAALDRFFGDLAVALVEAGVTRLVVSGGETSGAAVTSLKLAHLLVGPEIDPGVPALASVSQAGLPIRLALKSGNFGGDDFYERAFARLEAA